MQRMRIPRQLVLPRWSGILVEPRVDRVVQKFNIDLADLLQPAGLLEAKLVRSQLPGAAVRAAADLRAAIESGYDSLGGSAADIDPTLTRPVQGAKHQALAGVNDIERKLIQHLNGRQETELAQLSKARNLAPAREQAPGTSTHRGVFRGALWFEPDNRADRRHRGVVRYIS